MRIDPSHAAKCRSAITTDNVGGVFAKIDVDHMHAALMRLSAWERGILTTAVLRAITAKRPTLAQRALLALFLSDREEGSND